MINEKMLQLGTKRSIIREIFEYGKKRKAEVGEENVFDFTLGNPSIPAPKEINDAVIRNLNRKDARRFFTDASLVQNDTELACHPEHHGASAE